MAAHLRQAGWPVLVSALPARGELCRRAQTLALQAGVAEVSLSQKTAPNLIIDALFGAGYDSNRPLPSPLAAWVDTALSSPTRLGTSSASTPQL